MFVKHFIGGLAATAVLQTAVCRIDCNPSLYIADWWFRHGRPTMESLLLVRTHRCIASLSPPPSHHPFENQCIWIIGASSGIGEELAYQLVSPISYPRRQPKTYHHPIHLILSSRSVDRLQLVAATCQNYNRNSTITILPMDVTKDDDIYNAIQHLGTLTTTPANTTDSTHAVGGLALDTVVFNAGVGHLSPAIETSPTMIDKVWKQTARYPMIIIPLLLNNNNTSNLWKHAARPHFVVTSSIAAMIPVPLSSVYGAAKAALWNYCRTLHSECPHLLLHTIMPGPVDTPFHQHHHNRAAMNHHVTNDAVSSTPPRQSAQSPMKMTVQRCVQLMISTMRLSYSTESWLVPSSSSSPLSMLLLVGLYWHKLLPIAFLQSMVYSRIGLKRIRMWRKGYDLYDPKSWRS